MLLSDTENTLHEFSMRIPPQRTLRNGEQNERIITGIGSH